MKYAIVSDIHANRQAWKAVWLDIRSLGADQVICLGDVVGYGPCPGEVLEALYTSVDVFLLGNHDAAVCGLMDPAPFNDSARQVIAWTRERLDGRARRFLADQPLTLAGDGFRCAHSSFAEPGRFCYVFEPEDAVPSWNAVPEPLLFVGHTHVPCISVIGQSGTPRMIGPEDFELEEGKRFLVNVGSVGHPRDGDPRSSYCLYDSERGSVFWRKVPFDLDAYRETLEAAGLPAATSPFLEFDPRRARPPVRDLVPFVPPAQPTRVTLEVAYLNRLRRGVRRWKLASAAAAAGVALAGALAFWFWQRPRDPAVDIPAVERQSVRAVDYAPESNLVSLPAAPVAAERALPNWDRHLGDGVRQWIAWGPVDGDQQGFLLRSEDAGRELWVESAPVHVTPDMKMTLHAQIKKSDDFAGSLALALVLVQRVEGGRRAADGGALVFETNRNFAVKEPTLARQEGWSAAKQTVELPARAHSVALQIRGRFQGTALVRDVRLERKP